MSEETQPASNIQKHAADVLTEMDLAVLSAQGIEKADVTGVFNVLPNGSEDLNLVPIGRKYVEVAKKDGSKTVKCPKCGSEVSVS